MKAFCSCTLLILLILAGSCKKDDPAIAPTTKEPKIYLAGYVLTGASMLPAYYSDGKVTTTATESGSIYRIVRDGDDVYILGSLTSKPGITIWKNGVPAQIGSTTAVGFGMVVLNHDLYVAGNENDNGKIATLWKNGNATPLPTGNNTNVSSTETFDMALIGNDIYIAGNIRSKENPNGNAAVWMNGELQWVSDNKNSGGSEVRDMKVSGTDLYLFGVNNPGLAYWKNNGLVQLGAWSNQSQGTDLYGITVSGNDVYFAGISRDASTGVSISKGIFLKNEGELVFSGDDGTYFSGAATLGSDLYVWGVNNSNATLLYKNGTIQAPFDGTNTSFQTLSIGSF